MNNKEQLNKLKKIDELELSLNESIIGLTSIEYTSKINSENNAKLNIANGIKVNIPTYDGSGQLTHPKILYFEDGWNNYKYWLAYTPYPNEDDDYENPCICVSNDGLNFIVPTGLTNPLDIPTTNELQLGHFNSDVHILMVNNTMEIWWRRYDNSNVNIYRRTSKDGINWTEKEFLFRTPRVTSPSVVYENNKYKMWYCTGNDSQTPNKIAYCESTDAKTWGDITICNIEFDNGFFPWHLDIVKRGSVVEALVMCKSSDKTLYELFYAKSGDGINYTPTVNILKPRYGKEDWDNTQLYRSTFCYVGNKVKCFYCAIDNNRGNWIGVTEGSSMLGLGNVTLASNSSILLLPSNSFTPTDTIDKFPKHCISITKITNAFAKLHNFPQGDLRGGILKCENVIPENGFQKLFYMPWQSSQEFRRSVKSDGSWNDFTNIVEGRFLEQYGQVLTDEVTINGGGRYDFTFNQKDCNVTCFTIFNPKYQIPQGIFWQGICYDGNIVKLRLNNFTQNAITVPANTWNYTVLTRGEVTRGQ